MNTRTIKQIDATTDYFLSDVDDRQAVKLYLYQSIMNITKTEAAKLLGVTSSRGSQLNRTHLKAFKESDQYRKKLNEIERVCASDFMANKLRNFRTNRQPIILRSEKAVSSIIRNGLDSRFCELPNELRQIRVSFKPSIARVDTKSYLELMQSLNRMSKPIIITK